MDTKIKITPEMVKNFKTVTCTCGGQLFQTGVVIKKISALVSPTGQEVDYPIEVLVCMNCHKVPRSEDQVTRMLPDSVLSAPVSDSAKFEFPKESPTGKPVTDTFTGNPNPLSIVRDITEGKEKGNNKIVTTPKPTPMPAPQTKK
jgi:hypothetical protein